MRVKGEAYRTIWAQQDHSGFNIIDQTCLPHRFEIVTIRKVGEAATAIADMRVRGAPLIGITAAYGLALAMKEDPSDQALAAASARLASTRPTAVNLCWALDQMAAKLFPLPPIQRAEAAFCRAAELADEDAALCESIGMNGLPLIAEVAKQKGGKPVNILTHCNAGWLATVDWGTATAPIYKAHDAGINVHVWVDETRPRNQGASLTAWEMAGHGVPHTVIVDNAGGHLMQKGDVDLVIVGTDRTTARGDVCNKIGTYLKALAATDNNVPFYVAVPSPSIDFRVYDGLKEIEIETRSPSEVTHIAGETADLRIETIRLTPEASPALNPAFDVTPARLVTGLITERGLVSANEKALADAFQERVIEYRRAKV